MIAVDLAFYIFAAGAVFSAFMMVLSRNSVHSALWLITTFLNGAGLFLILGAELLAFVLIIIYAGAVAILFLFVVMMLNLRLAQNGWDLKKSLPTGIGIAGILLLDILVMVLGWSTSENAHSLRLSPMNDALTNTQNLGMIVYTNYFYLFQIAGLVLLVGMVGAILLTFRKEAGLRRQVISEQLDRHKDETITMNKVESGKGIS